MNDRQIANTLMYLDTDLWNELGIECGSDFLDENENYNELWNEYCFKVSTELKKLKIESVSKKTCNVLEDENFHSMLKVLKILKIA